MEIEEIEIETLLEAIRLRWGHDFRRYAKASLHRRIRKCLTESNCVSIADMIPLVIHDKSFFNYFLDSLTVNVTEMFRDPYFFKALREQVIPYLKSFHHLKIWSVGVSTGEEVYSLAIMLKEEELYDKCLIYATDFNDAVLEKAQRGVYSAQDIRISTKSYQQAGGRASLADYYHADHDCVIFNKSLKKNILFANHNLATDSVFGEMNLILCRNVLIYFNKDLQNRAFKLFDQSMSRNGFLCLGSKESINLSKITESFSAISDDQKIFKKTV